MIKGVNKMFIKERVKASTVAVKDYCLKDFWIKVIINNNEYRFDLLKTNIRYIMQFHLDYYKNSMFLNTETGEVMDTIFG